MSSMQTIPWKIAFINLGTICYLYYFAFYSVLLSEVLSSQSEIFFIVKEPESFPLDNISKRLQQIEKSNFFKLWPLFLYFRLFNTVDNNNVQ